MEFSNAPLSCKDTRSSLRAPSIIRRMTSSAVRSDWWVDSSVIVKLKRRALAFSSVTGQ
jgi:hypothetical protein